MTGGAPFRAARPGDEAAVQQVVFTVLREYGLVPEPDGVDVDLADLQGFYLRRGGAFLVVEDAAGAVAGCGGLLPVNDGDVELRKMYLAKALRGRGLGRALLEVLIDEARAMGCRRVVLDTASVLTEAIALYRARGFQPLERGPHVKRCDQAFFLDLADGGR